MSTLTLGHYRLGSSSLPDSGKYRLYYNSSLKTFNKIDSSGFNTTVDPVFFKQILLEQTSSISVDHSAGDIQYLYVSLTSDKDVSILNPVLDRTVILDIEMAADANIFLPTGSGEEAVLTNDSQELLTTSGSRNIISFHCIDDNISEPVYLTSIGTTYISGS